MPPQIVRAFSAFLEFCYLVRRDVIDEDTLTAISEALEKYHRERVIFEQVGVRTDGFSLPRQHSLKHYKHVILQFGAPNGLCSSITESKHIKAVKQPWRRSNRYRALEQMLTTNSRIDKLTAARVDFDTRGMLDTPAVPGIDPSHAPMQPQSETTAEGDDADREEDGAVEGNLEAEVVLAKSPCTSILFFIACTKFMCLCSSA